MKIFWTFIFICHSLAVIGQNPGSLIEIQGRIINMETKEPIPYVSIFNYKSQNGTISDIKGNFKVFVHNVKDTLYVSCIGFKKQFIPLSEMKNYYTIYLEQNIQLLDAVTITAPDDSYLYDLLVDCRKNSSTESKTAKAYFEIKSYASDKQIELLEAFYNAELKGSDVSELELKAGRFALKKTGNRFFTSMESSRAIIMNKLFAANEYFPLSPLEFSKSKIKKKFLLRLEKKYLENTFDSVYVLRYTPKDTSGVSFSGRIWINPQNKHLLKATFDCINCKVTPFIPLFNTDRLSNINLNITKTYKEINNKMSFNHIDFTYQFDYDSRIGNENEAKYRIMTNAVLHIYDYENKFFIPKFSFDEKCVRDYYKIDAMPYNDFFWKNKNEFEIIDHDNQNELFYIENEALSNKNLFSDNQYFKKVYESPFITWSRKRVLIKDITGDTLTNNPTNSGFIADKYKLSVKIFLDINTYSDSTNVLTSAVFDPWETYFHLPVTNTTNCFLNIYFDICEYQRRKFEKEVQPLGNNKDEILRKYDALNVYLEKLKNQYLTEVDRGSNRKEFEKWNQYVVDNIGINNFRLFNLTEGGNN